MDPGQDQVSVFLAKQNLESPVEIGIKFGRPSENKNKMKPQIAQLLVYPPQ